VKKDKKKIVKLPNHFIDSTLLNKRPNGNPGFKERVRNLKQPEKFAFPTILNLL
jgi:hypothetical protein